MRHSVLLKKASLVGAFFVSLFCVELAQAFCPLREDLPRFAVRQVVDGDTLRLVDGRSIRLIGINTPELGRKGRSDEPYAMQARRRLQALVDASDGRVGLLPGEQRKDRYGRTLAHLYDAQGRNLEAQLLAAENKLREAFKKQQSSSNDTSNPCSSCRVSAASSTPGWA